MMIGLPPINLKKWIDEHRALLKPPVGNRLIYHDTDFMIMIVAGPNSRQDFHINPTEEFFYQIEGSINLRLRQNDQMLDVPINEGEIYLLPPHVPHSPQRPKETIGLVIERCRPKGALDGFCWYCPQCNHKMYDEFFELKNIVEQLPPLFARFYGDPKKSTCNHCQMVMKRP